MRKRSKLDSAVAEMRDAILLLCIEGRLPEARAKLDELNNKFGTFENTNELGRQLRCRAAESELDIASFDLEPVAKIIDVLKRILDSQDFDEARRKEILHRGLSMIQAAR